MERGDMGELSNCLWPKFDYAEKDSRHSTNPDIGCIEFFGFYMDRSLILGRWQGSAYNLSTAGRSVSCGSCVL